MKKYQILMELNRREVCGEAVSGREKQEAVSVFLEEYPAKGTSCAIKSA